MKPTLSSLTGQLPHVTDVYYYVLCYNACLFKRKLGSVKHHYTVNPEKGQPMAAHQASEEQKQLSEEPFSGGLVIIYACSTGESSPRSLEAVLESAMERAQSNFLAQEWSPLLKILRILYLSVQWSPVQKQKTNAKALKEEGWSSRLW